MFVGPFQLSFGENIEHPGHVLCGYFMLAINEITLCLYVIQISPHILRIFVTVAYSITRGYAVGYEERNGQRCLIQNLYQLLHGCVIFKVFILLIFCCLVYKMEISIPPSQCIHQRLSNLVWCNALSALFIQCKVQNKFSLHLYKTDKVSQSHIFFTVINTLKNSCYEENVKLNSFLHQLP